MSKRIDDSAIDHFALKMKTKMGESRKKGRNGWLNRDLCSTERLANHFMDHIWKGNQGTFEDLAIYCMMLSERGDCPTSLAQAAQRKQVQFLHGLEDVVYHKTRLSEAEALLQGVLHDGRDCGQAIKNHFQKYDIAVRPEEEGEEDDE